jgi:2-iminobutanoate/2-iminopropanoate deaminase
MDNQNDLGGRTRGRLAMSLFKLVGTIAVLLGAPALAATAPAADHAPLQYIRAADPKAPFSAAVRVGNILYLSGQIGVGADGQLPPQFADQVHQTMENVAATLKESGSSLDDVFKCTVMLTDMSRWEEFNRIYVTYFKPERLPARSAIGANGLARGALLELECTAYSPRH